MKAVINHDLIPALVFLAECIFAGLKIFVPALFLVKIFSVSIKRPDINVITLSACFLVLMGGCCFMVPALIAGGTSVFSSVEGERDFFLSLLTGSQWYKFFVPALVYGLLPQLLWFRRFRTDYVLFFIVTTWFLAGFLLEFLSSANHSVFASEPKKTVVSLGTYLARGSTFIFLISFFYWLLSRRKQKFSGR